MPKGEYLGPDQILRVICLLRTTEMDIGELADYMGLKRQAISRINKAYNVRVYSCSNDHGTKWTINGEPVDKSLTVR